MSLIVASIVEGVYEQNNIVNNDNWKAKRIIIACNKIQAELYSDTDLKFFSHIISFIFYFHAANIIVAMH